MIDGMRGFTKEESKVYEESLNDLFNPISNQIMKWIKVTDSLPEPGERVLFATEVFVGEGYYSMAEEKWFRYGNNYSVESLLGEVIAWMPMPEYKEDTANE